MAWFHGKWLPQLWTAFLSLLASAAALSVPLCLAKAIDDGVLRSHRQALFFYVFVAATAQIISGLVGFWARRRAIGHGLSAERRLRARLFCRLMYADLRAFSNYASSDGFGQLLFASTSLGSFVEQCYNQGVGLVVSLFGTAILLLSLDPWLALSSFAIILPVLVFLYAIRKRIRAASRQNFQVHEGLYKIIVDGLRGLVTLRALGRTQALEKRFEDAAQRCFDGNLRLKGLLLVQQPFLDLLYVLIFVLLFALGGLRVVEGKLSLGILLGFQLYLSRLLMLARSSSGLYAAYQHYLEGRARAQSIEGLAQTLPVHFEATQGDEVLRITELSLSVGDKALWHELNLCLKAGDRQAILLPSGSGKSSLAKAILGFYPLDSGQIALPEAKTEHVGFVPQDNLIFSGTLRENIDFLRPGLPDSAYRELLYLTALEEVEASLENEHYSELEQVLSGGEGRRLALARALASEPKLLIIDQMSSELEPELCQSIFRRLAERRPQLAILYLGHREPEWAEGATHVLPALRAQDKKPTCAI